MSDQPELSVIVPFYNEQDSIRRMHAAIVAALEPLAVPFEMVFVNDGSRDDTLAIATEIAREDERVMVVNFRRNYGQTPAMAAGIEQARGRILVTMDGDLQNDPGDIVHFLAKIREGLTRFTATLPLGGTARRLTVQPRPALRSNVYPEGTNPGLCRRCGYMLPVDDIDELVCAGCRERGYVDDRRPGKRATYRLTTRRWPAARTQRPRAAELWERIDGPRRIHQRTVCGG